MRVPDPRARVSAIVFFLLASYAAAVVWLTWPLATRMRSDLPTTAPHCALDNLLIGCSLAHESRSLADDPTAIADAGTFHPSPRSLFYGEAAFGALPYFAPTFLATDDPTLALNVLFLGSVALTALALHVVTWRWTGSHAAGLVAATTYLTTRWVLWTWMPGAPNYAVLVYLPFIILFASEPAAGRSMVLGLIALVVLQGLVSPYYAVMTLVPLGLIALVRSLRPSSRRDGVRLLATLVAATTIIAVAYLPYVGIRLDNPLLPTQSVWSAVRLPRAVPFTWGTLIGPDGPIGVSLASIAVVALGLATRLVPFGERQVVARRAWAHATLWTVVGMFMALPVYLQLYGVTVHTPQSFVWPWLSTVIRDVARLGVAGLVGVSLLAGVAFAESVRLLGAWLSSRQTAFVGAFAALLIVAGMYQGYREGRAMPGGRRQTALPVSYPLMPAPSVSPAVRKALSQSHGAILVLPASTVRAHAMAMYAALFHGRPILNGYASYWPAGFAERMTLVCRLPEPDALEILRAQTGVETIVVHLTGLAFLDAFRGIPPYGCNPPLKKPPPNAEVERYAAQKRMAWMRRAKERLGQLELIAQDGTTMVFQVRAAPQLPAQTSHVGPS